MGAEAGVSCLSSFILSLALKRRCWALSFLSSSLIPRARQRSDGLCPGRSHHTVLVGCSFCVFILQESDSASALEVTPEGCDGKLSHGHSEEMFSPQLASLKGWRMPTPPAITDWAASGHFSNRIN